MYLLLWSEKFNPKEKFKFASENNLTEGIYLSEGETIEKSAIIHNISNPLEKIPKKSKQFNQKNDPIRFNFKNENVSNIDIS